MQQGWRRLFGYLSYGGGCLLACATVFAGFALLNRSGLSAIEFFVGLGVVLTLLFSAITLLVVTESFLVPSAREVLERDPRPPVLFLRSFGEDKPLVYDIIPAGEGVTTTITAKADDFLLPLNAIGPLVTIAEPNWAARFGLHRHGAYRDFVGADDWQARVQELLDQAGMVVLAIGDTPGVEWEIAEVQRRIGPESLLLYLPPRPASAFTRKGRAKIERPIYEQFVSLLEKHFDLTMPPYREAIYLIGFDAEGRAVMAPDAPHSRWALSEHGRITKAMRAQLQAVIDQVRPGQKLNRYQLVGRSGLWARVAFAVAVAMYSAFVVYSISSNAGQSPGLTWPLLLFSALPGLILTIGWALLARYFGRAWVWAIPLLVGLLVLINLLVQVAIQFRWEEGLALTQSGLYSMLTMLLYSAQAVLVLVLGMTLLQQGPLTRRDRSTKSSGSRPDG